MEVGERQKLDDFGIQTVQCVGRIFFHKKSDSVAVTVNLMGQCTIYFITTSPEMVDGFRKDFPSEEEAKAWLEDNQYITVRFHNGKDLDPV